MNKKPILIALCSILILAVAVVAIIKFTCFANKPDGSTDTMELSEVSGYVLKKGYTQEQIEEKLEERKSQIDAIVLEQKLAAEALDVTIPGGA